MGKIAIITDSCGDIPQDLKKKYHIFVLPMTVECANKEYKDGINITAQDVYEMQKTHLLKTASPAGGDIIHTLETLKDKGYTHAIAIMLSSGLSGTFNQVRLLAEADENIQVKVIDSKSASIGCGSIAIILSQYCQQGLSFDELVDKAQQLVQNNYVYFSIDTLEHLEKGGRIGKATAYVGTMLKIKPILSFEKDSGAIFVPAKVRGNKKVPAKLIDLVEHHLLEHPQASFYLLVADGGIPESRDLLEKALKEKFPQYKGCIQARIGAALSAYLGKGLLGAGIQFLDD